jgi:zinc transport system ATP-binding protein
MAWGIPMPLIDVQNLIVKYGNVEILQDVTFAVNQGDYLAIVGPNGSGKTTLIRTLLGLQQAAAGNITLIDQNVRTFNQWQQVGYLPQVSRALHEGFPATVREIVGTGLLAHKSFPKRLNRADQEAVEHILDVLQITSIADSMIGKLSGGQQQRALLARAMVSKPDLLILDEPTVALDPVTRNRFYDTIKELNKAGTTVILITHDSATVGQFASHLLYLDRKVVFFGSFAEFCHSPEMAEYFGGQQHMICHQH